MTMLYDTMPTPIGDLLLIGDGRHLVHIDLPQARRPLGIGADWRREPSAFEAARVQFDAYFSGTLHAFDVPLAPRGTDFQRRVWDALRGIGYGETISYAELARRVGNPKASRAVGLANGANPLSIVVPCHRVIGAKGALTGYGGGLEAKKWLLALEQRGADGAPFSLSQRAADGVPFSLSQRAERAG